MKNTFTKFIAAGCLAFLGTGAFAQSNQLSLGVDMGFPLGDFADIASFMVGPAAGFELPISDNLGITLQASYLIITPNSDIKDLIASMSAIPVQVGAKFYFTEGQSGLYGQAQLGIHAMSVKSEDFEILGTTVEGETTTSTNFSWGVGGGFQLEKLDIGVRYNSISPDSDAEGASASTYVGLRAAFLLNLGG